MPAKIGPDGKPIVVDTVPFKVDYSDDDATTPYNPNEQRRAPANFDDSDATEPYTPKTHARSNTPMSDPTRPLDIEEVEVNLGEGVNYSASTVVEDDDEATQVFRAPRAGKLTDAPVALGEQLESTESKAMQDPTVGWLVVTDGPGKGEVLSIGYGQNSVGRSGARINLNFGDTEISRESHITVIFDPKSRNFFIAPGTGKSLGYVEDSPILTPSIMKDRSIIKLGATTLRFVALCDDNFGWD